jgi:GR25 family glycosyltransferase involved in LPS biosynthesis
MKAPINGKALLSHYNTGMNLEFRKSGLESLREIDSYVINLPSRPDRRHHVVNQISKFQLNSIIIDAVSVEELGIRNFGFLSPPAMACWKSHLKVFEAFLQTNKTSAIIFEDDFQIVKMRSLERHLDNIKFDDFEIVQIGFLVNNFREHTEIFLKNLEFSFFSLVSRLCIKSTFFNARYGDRLRVQRAKNVPFGFVADDLRAGAHAYLISRSAALRIVSEFKDQSILTTDGFLIASNWTRPFRTMRLYKSLVNQIESRSSIR